MLKKTREVGQNIISLALILAPFLVFSALPFFSTGYWVKLEPVTIGLHGLGALVSAAILLLIISKDEDILGVLSHPVVIFPFSIGFLSFLLLPFADFPLLSVFGDPRLGQGAVRYFDLSALTAGALFCFRNKKSKLYIALSCTIATSLNIASTFYGQYHPLWLWQPYRFTEYLAFNGIFLVCISLTCIPTDQKWSRKVLIIIGLLTVGLSRNKAAIVLCGIIGPTIWVMVSLLNQRIKHTNRYAVILLLAIPLVISSGIYGMAHFGPNKFLQIGSISTQSLTSRGLLSRTAITAIKDKPSVLITGLGWGCYPDLLIRYAHLDNVNFTGDSLWDALARGDWHSHNDFLEVLLSTGIGGAILWTMYLCFLPLYCRPKFLAEAATTAAILTGLSCLWFQFSATLPMMAIAMAGFVSPSLKFQKKTPTVNIILITVVLLVFAMQLWACQYRYKAASHVYNQVFKPLFSSAEDLPKMISEEQLISNRGPGSIYFAHIFRHFMGTRNEQNNKPMKTLIKAYEQISNFSEKKVLAFDVAGLIIKSNFAFKSNSPQYLSPIFLVSWQEMISKFLLKAPFRSDMASTYFLYCLKYEQDNHILAISHQILQENSDDPIGLWFSGLALLGKNDGTEIATQYLRRAISNGVEKLIPIDSAIKKQVLDTY